MTDMAELNHEQVSAGASRAGLSSPHVERQMRKRSKTPRDRSLRLDAKSTDKLLRLFLAFPKTRVPRRTAVAEHTEDSQMTDQNPPRSDDLVHVHVHGSARFERDGREDSYEVLKQISCHPALQELNEAARMVATTSIFQARMAFRLKADGRYWVLGGLGTVYPYPLAIRTGAFPSWKRQIRSLEKLLEPLRKSASQALRLEADTMVGSQPEQMPAELIFDVEKALQKAISWMQAFPAPTDQRSKYRGAVRPDILESVGVVAYVLDRLYREHTGEGSLKGNNVFDGP